MSWLLSMYGDEDDPGEQQDTYYNLAPRIIEKSIEEQIMNAEYAGILENTPLQIIDPTPKGLDPLKVAGGVAATTAIGAGLYFGYHSIKNKVTKHRKSPEEMVKEQKAEKNQ